MYGRLQLCDIVVVDDVSVTRTRNAGFNITSSTPACVEEQHGNTSTAEYATMRDRVVTGVSTLLHHVCRHAHSLVHFVVWGLFDFIRTFRFLETC